MSFFHDMPHTTEYDGDLGWLIFEYKELGKAVTDLQDRVNTLEELYKTIPETLDAAIADMQKRVDDALQLMQNSVNAQIEAMQKEIADAKMEFAQMQADMQAQFVIWQNTFNQLVADFNKLFGEIQDYVESHEESLKYWVRAELDRFSKTYPWLMCPVDGQQEALQDILYHMYNELSWGIRVYEFDGFQMTAQELDDMQLKAYDLDHWGCYILHHWYDYRRMCYMFSPFTGEYVPISDVVLALARLHQNAVTAGEFDDADLDVEMLDEKNVTAYDFDWSSVWFDEISGRAA